MSSICANQDLFVDLNETDAETVSGGIVRRGGAGQNEIFKIKNQLPFRVAYIIDGRARNLRPGQSVLWFTNEGGNVTFDSLPFRPRFRARTVNAANGREYVFQFNSSTFRPFDITLADNGAL
ncbi:MAG: hypothetical protein F6J98_39020 [Moorea sp. SIO4G2]|nr:hypothetical protein [Moorena sp. SIO4G2]